MSSLYPHIETMSEIVSTVIFIHKIIFVQLVEDFMH